MAATRTVETKLKVFISYSCKDLTTPVCQSSAPSHGLRAEQQWAERTTARMLSCSFAGHSDRVFLIIDF